MGGTTLICFELHGVSGDCFRAQKADAHTSHHYQYSVSTSVKSAAVVSVQNYLLHVAGHVSNIKSSHVLNNSWSKRTEEEKLGFHILLYTIWVSRELQNHIHNTP